MHLPFLDILKCTELLVLHRPPAPKARGQAGRAVSCRLRSRYALKEGQWNPAATVAICMEQHVIFDVKGPDGIVLNLSKIAERIDRIIHLAFVPLERENFV